jgi:hypothetical protein
MTIKTNSINKQEEILTAIRGNMSNTDFAQYMNYCVKKWERLKVDLEIIDAIMGSICAQWNISKNDLVADKKFADARAMMYYVIKKQINLSYGEIGEMFRISKSYVHKAVDDVAFVVENNGAEKVKKNEVKQMNKNDLLIVKANGNPDDKEVQDARRVLTIRGISWEQVQPMENKDLVSIFRSIQIELSEKSMVTTVGGVPRN